MAKTPFFLLRSGVAVKNSSFGENQQTRVSVFFSSLLRIKCDLQTKCVKKNSNTVFHHEAHQLSDDIIMESLHDR